MTTEDAKTYLAHREIPKLFESLMTGLMYHRPTNHIQYLIDCLQKCQEKKSGDITWSSFVDIRRTKTPLPPINDKKRPGSKEGSRPSSKTRAKGEEVLSLDMGNIEDSLVSRVITPTSDASGRGSVISLAASRTATPVTQGRPLSGSNKEEQPPRDTKSSPLPAIPTSTDKLSMPDIPVVLLLGAPGCNKEAHVERLMKRYPGWQHINMGTLIREEIGKKGDAHTKWKLTKDLMSRGEPASEEVTIEVLIEGLKRCSSAKGVVVTGFPRDMDQVTDYENKVGRVDVVFMIDCDESVATDKLLHKGKNSNRPEDSMTAIANKMNYFKAHTLASAKHFDDQGKLVVVNGEEEESKVSYEMGLAFDKLFLTKYGKEPVGDRPTSASSSVPEPSTYKAKYEKDDSDAEEEEEAPLFDGPIPQPPVISEPDTGRKPDLPQVPIIFVAGGPGSGKGTQCARILKRYPNLVHLSMGDIIRTEISTKGTADDVWGMVATLVSKGEMAPEEVTIDLLKAEIMKHKDAKGFLIEGFPRDKAQLEAFNKHIGGLSFVMLFDCEEYYMKARLVKRGKESGRVDDNLTAIANRVKFYKNNTIPLMKSIDNEKKLIVRHIKDLDADRDMDEMFYDISNLLDFALFGKSDETEPEKSEPEKSEPEKSEPVDESVAATKIQAGFRGYMVRSQKQEGKQSKVQTEAEADEDREQALKHKSDLPVEMDEKVNAAVVIKAGFAGLRKRQESQSKLTNLPDHEKAKLAADKKTLNEKAKLTAGKQSLAEKAKSLSEEEEAAIRIRASFQSHAIRKQHKAGKTEVKVESNEQTNVSDVNEKDKAAMDIRAAFSGHKTRKDKSRNQETKPKAEAVPAQDEVVEPTITAEGASTTGDNIANPSHTKKLEESADS